MTTETKIRTKLDTVKTIARFATKHAASATIVTLIHQNTQTFNKNQKIQLYIGAYLVGQVVADAAWSKCEEQIDEIVSIVKSFRDGDTDEEVHSVTNL